MRRSASPAFLAALQVSESTGPQNPRHCCPQTDSFCSIDDSLKLPVTILLQDHKLKCLHVGQETINDQNGKPWHTAQPLTDTLRKRVRLLALNSDRGH